VAERFHIAAICGRVFYNVLWLWQYDIELDPIRNSRRWQYYYTRRRSELADIITPR